MRPITKAEMSVRPGTESGDVIVSWLIKLVVGFAVAGVLVFDLGALAVNFFGLDSTAQEMAHQLATDVVDRGIENRPDEVKLRAKELAETAEVKLRKVRIDGDGVIHLRLSRQAETVVLSRIGALDDYTTATADATSGTS